MPVKMFWSCKKGGAKRSSSIFAFVILCIILLNFLSPLERLILGFNLEELIIFLQGLLVFLWLWFFFKVKVNVVWFRTFFHRKLQIFVNDKVIKIFKFVDIKLTNSLCHTAEIYILAIYVFSYQPRRPTLKAIGIEVG